MRLDATVNGCIMTTSRTKTITMITVIALVAVSVSVVALWIYESEPSTELGTVENQALSFDISTVEARAGRTLRGSGSGPSPPTGGIQEFVDHSDAIVVATIGQLISDRREGPYDDEDGVQSDVPEFALPFIRYELLIEDILVDDGNVGDNAVLRLSAVSEANRPVPGEKLLLVLGVNPDGQSYGLLGDFAAIQMGGQEVQDYSGNQLDYSRGTAPADFVRLVNTAVENRVKKRYSRWGRTF